MAIKIMIDPGHMAGWNTMANGYCEGNQMWALSQKLIPKLKAYGFTVGCTKDSINDYPKQSNGEDYITERGRMAKGYDVELSLHTNAASAASVNRPVVIYPISGKCKDLSAKLGAALQKCMGLQTYQIFSKKNSSGTADYYGVIRGAASVGVPCLIVEHTFHTNDTMARWLMVDSNLDKLADCLADTVADYYGYKKATTETVEPTTGTSSGTTEMYRVRKAWNDAKSQIGAYRDFANAKAACKSGYKVFDKDGKVVYDPSTTSTVKKEYPQFRDKTKAKGVRYKVNASDGLNMRAGAGVTNLNTGKENTIIKSLDNGSAVWWYGFYSTVYGTDWYWVRAEDGTTGFVSSKYLTA